MVIHGSSQISCKWFDDDDDSDSESESESAPRASHVSAKLVQAY